LARQNRKREVGGAQIRMLTVPNLVSALRLAAAPYLWYVLFGQDDVRLAAVLVFVIGATDWVDGYLARRLNQVSEVGKFLDPLADRLMIASALLGGLLKGVVPGIIGWPLVVREVLVGLGALYLAGRRAGKLEVRWAGKVATFALYGAIPSFYLGSAGVLPWLFTTTGWIIGVVGLVLYYQVGFLYALDIRQRLAGHRAPPAQ